MGKKDETVNKCSNVAEIGQKGSKGTKYKKEDQTEQNRFLSTKDLSYFTHAHLIILIDIFWNAVGVIHSVRVLGGAQQILLWAH